MAEESNSSESFLNPSRRSYVYESSRNSGNKKRIILIVVGILILIGLVALAVVATGGKGETEKNLTPTPTQITQTPTPTPTLEPSPTTTVTPTSTPKPTSKVTPTPAKGTPTPTSSSGVERSNLDVAVLNGSGEAGAATKASDALKKLGYNVVSSGNADNFDYATTQIQVKSTKKAYLDMLKTDLSDTYTITSATADYTGTSADAVVIVGKK
jgi:cytoskeletal protein RodZ